MQQKERCVKPYSSGLRASALLLAVVDGRRALGLSSCHSRLVGDRGSGGCGPQAMSYNWERFYAWEKHPMLNNNLRHALPGFKYGFGAFLLYVVYDKVAHSGKKAHR